MTAGVVKGGGRRWQFLLAAILIIFAGGMATSLYLAGKAGMTVVDRDYYERGKNYELLAQRQRTAEDCGWRLQASREGSRLVVTVTDRDGRGVTGAMVRFLPSTQEKRGAEVRLAELGNGRYAVTADGAVSSFRGRLQVDSAKGLLSCQVRDLSP